MNKTLQLDVNWVDRLDGRTIKEAIEYLETLNPEHVLDCYLDGDTHGCDIVSRLTYEVPMTPKEMYQSHEKRILRDIVMYENSKVRLSNSFVGKYQKDRMDNCDKHIASLKDELEKKRLLYED